MVGMSDAGDGRTTPQFEPPPVAGPGWYPDFWTKSRRRYWTGSAWTFSTAAGVDVDDPPPLDPQPLPDGHGLPAPVASRPAAATAAATAPEATGKRPQKAWKWILAVVVGLLVGLAGVALSTRSSDDDPPAAQGDRTPSTDPAGPPSTNPSLSPGNDPSASALGSLVVKPEDVPATASVVVFPGGIGLDQPTLDLCNGRYPSESRRTARIQDAVLDDQGVLVLSTEAVLYGDSGATAQAFDELRSVTAACPSTPVPGPAGEPAVTTQFNAPPDGDWPQVPTVNRLAYDLTSVDGSGRTRHTIAVYLQRGRVLLGVYFAQPDGPQTPVEGQTTIEGIVGVFAGRLAGLPTSVVGS